MDFPCFIAKMCTKQGGGEIKCDFFSNIKYMLKRKLLYLTPVKTQLIQYNLTRDLMLFYHSNKIKA